MLYKNGPDHRFDYELLLLSLCPSVSKLSEGGISHPKAE